MRALRAWIVRTLSLFRRDGGDREFRDELESHVQMHVDDNIRAGMSVTEARRHALIRLGGVEALREAHRNRRGVPALQHLWRDLRHASRSLRRQPAFTAVVVLTLALGVGANTSIFTLVNAVLLDPLPYPASERLAMVWGTDTASEAREVSISYPDFEAWRAEARSFESIAAFTSRAVTLGGGDQPELVPALQTTTELFRVLRVEPLIGRTFSEADAGAGAPAVAVLSDAAWMRLFGGRTDAIGTVIAVNQKPHTVIGVVPGSMHVIPTETEQVYTLLPRETDRMHGYLRTVARLRPGSTFESAQAEMDVLTRRIAAEFPRSHANSGASVVRLADAGGRPVRDALLVLLALVGAVLLIACANVANLLLARNASRHHELALRVSLGATRGRLLQQLLAESALLAIAGGAAGLLLARVATDFLLTLLEGAVPFPRLERAALDGTVLGFAVGVSALTGVLFGVVPAFTATPRRLSRVNETGRTVVGHRTAKRTRSSLVVFETAVALVLLAAATVLGRSFVELRGTPTGFVPDDVLAVGLRLPDALTPGEARGQFFEALRARLAALPTIGASGFVSSLPLGGGSDSLQFKLVDRPAARPGSANFNIATPGYFDTMRIPIVAGREFAPGDTTGAPLAIVINETAAKRLWPGASPLGRQIVLSGRTEHLTVIGVAGDVRQSSLGSAPRAEIYLNGLQPGPDWSGFALVVRSTTEPAAIVGDVRAALRAVNPDVAIAKIAPMEEVISMSLAQPRIYTSLIGSFAVVAVLLAAVGLYGVMSYSVVQQTRELGIRLALGSSPGAIVRAVLRQGTLLTGLGIVIGAMGAYWTMRGMARVLPGAGSGGALMLAGVAVLMILIGAAASLVPARRAARVDPLAALRVE